MKRFAKLALSLVALASSGDLYAWSHIDYVIEVGSFSDGHAVVKFRNATWHGCNGAGGEGEWFSLGTSGEPEKRQNMLAIATAALATGKPVYIITGPACSASGNEEKVEFISIRD